MYVCKYFEIHELVPPHVFRDRGELAWELMDERLLITLDNIREFFGKTTVNNYYWGGNREWSGLRTADSPYYSPYSQHSFGRGADCIFPENSVEEVRSEILTHRDHELFRFINAVELGTSWLHIDVRNCNRIKTFRP